MNVSDVLGRNVMDLSTATTIGRVDDIVIDPTAKRVVGFHLGKTSSGRPWLPFDRIKAVGADAVTIDDDTVLDAPPPDLLSGLTALKALGGRLLTDEGREIGPLRDIAFGDDGAVTELSTADSTVGADALLGIGSYAVVITDPRPAP